jgi:hypothetical protein
LYRTTIRFYQDTWLARDRTAAADPLPFRERRRVQWLDELLLPLRDTHGSDALQQLRAALCLVAGGEAMTVMRDVCRLERDDALAAMRWAAEALLAHGLRNAGTAVAGHEA